MDAKQIEIRYTALYYTRTSAPELFCPWQNMNTIIIYNDVAFIVITNVTKSKQQKKYDFFP